MANNHKQACQIGLAAQNHMEHSGDAQEVPPGLVAFRNASMLLVMSLPSCSSLP